MDKIAIAEHAYNSGFKAGVKSVERHGYWEYSKIANEIYCSCSACQESPECFEPRYCPNCGAKMDGGDK